MIAQCEPADLEDIYEIINDAASAYRGVIAANCWKQPYLSREELRREIDGGVVFWGFREAGRLVGVMGLQRVREVVLIRHAYTRTANQRRGVGAALLAHLQRQADRPLLVGTWKAAAWAIRFYQRHGFERVPGRGKDELLRRYWTVPARQIEESVVLADEQWFASRERAYRQQRES